MFLTDQPINTYKEDFLGRQQFAQSLGNAILKYKDKESIVVGLLGEWGSGKTSLINLVLEYIKSENEKAERRDKTIIVQFNPWNFSDQNQLITQFFKQLSVVLRRHDYAEDAKKAGEQLETYASFFEPLALIPTVGTFAGIFSKVFKTVGAASKSWGDLKANDLDSIRSELNRLLFEQPHKIIIVIDDIDRLNNTEIRQIFQLIKSLGDFPNTIYLLAFDKNIVINALCKVQEGSGLEYLEKMLQVSFEVPLISRQIVEDLLQNMLNELVKNIPDSKWNQTYWGNIYHSGFKYFFHNIRDVIRYINTLRFGFELVKDEVNLIDYIAITGIQVFMPELYYAIRDNKELFTGAYSDFTRTDPKHDKELCDEILNKQNVLQHEVIIDFLKRMFPKLEKIYSNNNYGSSWLQNWRKEGRVCSPDLFDIFFKHSLPNGEISQGVLDSVISCCHDTELLTEALLNLNKSGNIVRFLERFADYIREDIPIDCIETIICAFMDIGDLFPEGESGFVHIDTAMRILSLNYQLSQRLADKESRFEVFKHAIVNATRSIYTIVDEVSVQDQQHGKYGLSDSPQSDQSLTVNSEQLIELEKLACSKIKDWASNGHLANHRHLLSILYRWKNWGEPEDVKNFVTSLTIKDDDLIDFVTSFLSKSTSHGISDYVGKINWYIDINSVKDFVEIDDVVYRVRKIKSSIGFDKLEDRKKLAINTLLDTVDGKIKNRF